MWFCLPSLGKPTSKNTGSKSCRKPLASRTNSSEIVSLPNRCKQKKQRQRISRNMSNAPLYRAGSESKHFVVPRSRCATRSWNSALHLDKFTTTKLGFRLCRVKWWKHVLLRQENMAAKPRFCPFFFRRRKGSFLVILVIEISNDESRIS